ncbi:MAG: hypothetical protein GYB31_11805 [Bacteroidetes bacterium]|nr:hypothetical protein [Bacteroidota bacterium]
MQNTKVVQLLNTLSRKEIRRMEDFLSSPYFNKRDEVSRLFRVLIEELQFFREVSDKEAVFAKVAGKKKTYDDQQLRLWMSYLSKAIGQFLLIEAFAERQISRKTDLLAIYRERNLPRLQESQLRELEKLQEKIEHRHAGYFQNDFRIQQEKYRFLISSRRMSDLNLHKTSKDLDIYYISQKLRQACLALAHQAVYKTEYQYGLLPEIMQYVESENLLEIPAIGVYYHGYKALSATESDAPFGEFKAAILHMGRFFPADELGDLYILAINFCIRRYNAGDPKYLKDEFDLYQDGLEHGLFYKNNNLSRFTYRNIVTLGLVLNEFEWVEGFIHEYRPKLSRPFRESMYSFSLARLEYSRKNYDAALQLLQKSDYKDLLLNLAAKTVMLKIFYELEEFDLLNSHLEAMRMFIRRKNIMGYHKTNYSKLINFMRKLVDLPDYDKEARNALKNEIQNTAAVAEKAWLLERFG